MSMRASGGENTDELIFLLSLALERTLNAVWHLGETMMSRKLSCELLVSVLTWLLAYLLVRYSLQRGEIPLLILRLGRS